MPRAPEIRAASIVIRGHFTPAIFQPSWFAAQNLLPKPEAEAAEIQVIHSKVAAFSAGWLQLQVLEDRFHASTTQVPYFEVLRDLTQGAFEVLNQTPMRAIGLNQSFHFPLGSKDTWHKVGHSLAPKELWNSLLKEPGMLSLTIQGKREDDYDGYVNVRVEPSLRVQFGLFIEINDHYQLFRAERQDIPPGTAKVVSILSSDWEKSISRGDAISEGILRVADS